MKKIYTSIYNFFIVLKVVCPIISFLYALLWFVGFFGIPFYTALALPFEPFAQIIRTVHPVVIMFQDTAVDMAFIVASGLFIGFHYVFGFFAQRVVDLYNFEEERINARKKQEIKHINHLIKREFDEEIERYISFTVLFNLMLKPAYNLSVSRKGEFSLLKKDFYTHIVKNVSSKYKNAKGIMSDKMFLVCEDFIHFDDFIVKFLNEIKEFNAENLKKDITTEFSISIDAIKSGANVFKAMEFLEKIDSFNYKNKLIATSAFKIRYEKAAGSLFRTIPLGTSRFFEEPDDFIDFELFHLKMKNKK